MSKREKICKICGRSSGKYPVCCDCYFKDKKSIQPIATQEPKPKKTDDYKGKWDSKYPHFRYYIKAKHPALITKEYSENEYAYRKVMHSEKDGRHLNEKIEPNPNAKDNKPMYIAKRERHDKKTRFSRWVYKWKYDGNKKK